MKAKLVNESLDSILNEGSEEMDYYFNKGLQLKKDEYNNFIELLIKKYSPEQALKHFLNFKNRHLKSSQSGIPEKFLEGIEIMNNYYEKELNVGDIPELDDFFKWQDKNLDKNKVRRNNSTDDSIGSDLIATLSNGREKFQIQRDIKSAENNVSSLISGFKALKTRGY